MKRERKTNNIRWYEKFIDVDFGEEYGVFLGTAYEEETGKLQYEFSGGKLVYYKEFRKIVDCMNEAIKAR